MPYVFVRHKVEDYAKWKAGFDDDGDVRKAGGSTGAQVFRDADDPSVISVLLEMTDMESVQTMMQRLQTPEMQEIMREAGVVGEPEAVYVFGSVEETSA